MKEDKQIRDNETTGEYVDRIFKERRFKKESLDESFDRLYGTNYAKKEETVPVKEIKIPKVLSIILKVLTFFVAFFITGPNPGGYSFYTTNRGGKITGLHHVNGGQNHIHCHIAGFFILALNIFILWEICYNDFEFPIMKDILPGIFVIISLIQIYRAFRLLYDVYPPEIMTGSEIGSTTTINRATNSSYRGSSSGGHSSNNNSNSNRHENIADFQSYVNMKMSVMSDSSKADYMHYINGGNKK